MIRTDLTTPSRVSSCSTPMRYLYENGYICKDTSVFDYGCGYGGDVKWLRDKGIVADGWDLHHYQGKITKADIVTCLYVINVIPTWQEREWVLNYIYSLGQKDLFIAIARYGTKIESNSCQFTSGEDLGAKTSSCLVAKPLLSKCLQKFNDGIITKHRTFEKLYSHEECLELLRGVFGVSPELVTRNTYRVRVDKHKVSERSRNILPINSTIMTNSELRKLYNRYERKRSRLKQKGWLKDHVKLERVEKKNFYRLRSPIADIPSCRNKSPFETRDEEKGLMVKVLKAENKGSKNYQWIQELLERTEEIKIIDARLKHLRYANSNKIKDSVAVKNCPAPLWFFEA